MFRSFDYLTAHAEGWVGFGARPDDKRPCPLRARLAFLLGDSATWESAPFTLSFTWGPARQTAQAQLRRANEPLWSITYTWDPLAEAVRRHLVAMNGTFGGGVERAIDECTTETTLDLTLPDGERIRFTELMTRHGRDAFTTKTRGVHASPVEPAKEMRWVRAG